MQKSNKGDLNIALLQLDLAWENPEDNIAQIDAHMNDSGIRNEDCDVIVLPEMWATGFTMQPKKQGVSWKAAFTGNAQDWPNPLQAMLRWSQQHDTAVVGSLSCHLIEEDRCVNRCFFITPEGLQGWYDKRHLFRFAGEDEAYNPGTSQVVIPWRGWNILLQICYDLRFPESSRNQEMKPYDLALYVANWPEVRSSAWKALLPARAIENQAYVAGVNRIGEDGMGINHNGLSSCYTPKGDRIAESTANQSVWLFATLDKKELLDYRSRFPVLKDRL